MVQCSITVTAHVLPLPKQKSNFYKMKKYLSLTLSILLLAPVWGLAQKTVPIINSTLEGKVLDAKTKAPLQGAVIQIKGTTHEVVSDADGVFNFKTGQKFPYILVITFVGYQTTEITADGSPIEIALKEGHNQLNEVVVVGYGTQRKGNLTGSVASVNKALLEQPVPSFDNLLQGAVPGVAVTQSSGQPGSTATIRVRGGNSISFGNDPLYVIDGFIVYSNNNNVNTGASNGVGVNALSTINPSDIETIDILKDASATAIYGSRGANGVVIITTRRGSKKGVEINYNGFVGNQSPRSKLDLLNGSQWAALVNDINESDGKPHTFTDDQVAAFGKGYDWQNESLRNAIQQNHELSFSGGDDKSRFLISGNYYDQDGIVINSNFKRYSARINYERKISERLKLSANVFGSNSNENKLYGNAYNSINFQQTAFANLVQVSPIIPIYNEDGSYNINNPYQATPTNIIQDIAKTTNTTYISRILANASVDYKITRDLTLKITGGTDLLNTRQNYYSPSYAGSPAGSSTGYAVQGYGSIGSTRANTWINENTLTYDKDFNDRHSLNVLVGYTAQSSNDETAVASAQKFPNDLTKFNNLSYASTPVLSTSGATESALNSFLGRVHYSFDRKYNITASLRADGSSKLGANNRWGYFPSIGLSWNIGEERFAENLKPVLSNAKIRFSAGQTGNSEIPPYSSLATLTPTNYFFNSTLVTGISPSQIANPNLKWETTTQYNAGVDFGLLSNRINVTFDAYYKKTSDLLLNVPFPLYTGYASSLQNVGSVENKGYEFSISSDNVKTRYFTWRSTLVFAANKNKILSLGEGTNFYFPLAPTGYVSPVIVKVGLPVGTFWGYDTDGLLTAEDISKGAPTLAGVPQLVGDRKYVDTNGDGKVTTDDKHNLGTAQPKFTYGFSNQLTFAGFDLSFLLQGSYGNKIFNFLQQKLELTTVNLNTSAKLLDRYSATNPNGTMPRATNAPVSQVADIYVEDGSYLRLKNITLGYNLPESLISKIKVKKLRVFVTAQNFLTWTSYSGLDPEVNFFDTDNTKQGIDYGAYPAAKSILGGLSITF